MDELTKSQYRLTTGCHGGHHCSVLLASPDPRFYETYTFAFDATNEMWTLRYERISILPHASTELGRNFAAEALK